MKKKLVVAILAFLTLSSATAYAKESETPYKLMPVEATAYHYGEITASGTKPRTGICAAKKEWIGLTAVVYERKGDRVGDLIGIYEIQDTGGDYRIRNGTCIDIYIPNEAQCWEFGRQDVFVQIMKVDG